MACRFSVHVRVPALVSMVRAALACSLLGAVGGCSLSSTQSASRDADHGAVAPADHNAGGDSGGDDGRVGVPDAADACGPVFNVCVDSCGIDISGGDWAPASQVCEDGALRCPGETFNYGTCPQRSCARRRVQCCDLTTGEVTLASCQVDGLRGCPAGTPETQNYYGCVPTALAASGCVFSLNGQTCAGPAHNCADGLLHCACDQPDGNGGMAWTCQYGSGIP
jgi:hypothetical protein